MFPDLDKDVVKLSDKELLDAIEKVLRAPGFVDVCLGYDVSSNTFYAGEEIAGSLRDVLRRVLIENRPNGLSLRDAMGRSCPAPHSSPIRVDTADKSAAPDSYRGIFPHA